jgi:hypothetical protein
LVEDETIEEVDIRDPVFNDGNEDRILYGDENETLVVRKSLLAPKGDFEEDWLRTNIFHTTSTITEKVCMIIIDSGSCENVVSEEVVKKLQLKTNLLVNMYIQSKCSGKPIPAKILLQDKQD